MVPVQELPRPVRHRPARPRRLSPSSRPTAAEPTPDSANWPRDHGIELLAIFTSAVFAIVALTVVVGAVDQWWILIPVMAIHFALTAAVLTMTARLIDDGD